MFERNEYDTTYIVQDVDQIQEYIPEQQDGVYYLTVLTGNVSPTVTSLVDQKFKQSPYYLYPVVDKDNLNLDPVQTVSAASNSLIGKTLVNDGENSLTKESTFNYLLDNRIGYAITGAVADSVGIQLSSLHRIINSVQSRELIPLPLLEWIWCCWHYNNTV